MFKIPVVFTTDENYVMPTAVTITSLLLNTSDDVFYDVFVLTASDVSKASKDRISQCEKLSPNCSITIIDVSKEEQRLTTLNAVGFFHITVAAYLNFYIPKYLPQYEKVIYLDSDLLVRKNLKELYQIDIGNNLLGACLCIYVDSKSRNLFQNKFCPDTCINSGVLLMNLGLFRQERIETELEKNINTFDGLLADQAVLNLVCKNRIMFLPYTYNVYAGSVWQEKNLSVYYPLNEIRESIGDPAIVHYPGAKKPWHNCDIFLAREWFRYYLASPFKDTALNRIVSAENPAVQRKPESLINFAAGKKYVVIYGMDVWGEKTAKCLEKENIPISAFVLSDGIKKPASPYTSTNGTAIPVYSISELPLNPAETGLILALSTKHVNEVLPYTKPFDFVHIFQGGGTK